jgi:superfamily II DNA or RNA helicase
MAAHNTKVNERYNAFQREAVANIVEDFRREPNGRFLLVVPTGGGKTTTAVKAVSQLYDVDLLKAGDRVIWIVHRDELRTQARKSFEHYAAETGKSSLPGHVDVLMLSEIKPYLQANPDVRFAVIDEAHHAAARSYQVLFEKPALGILGLTATPSRHDGLPLQFMRESFSIGFPDLVSMGVLLRPTVLTVYGGTYDITSIDEGSDSLEALNNVERNARILGAIEKDSSNLHKVIVYVGTRQHARDLYKLLRSSSFIEGYESLSIILGDERRRYIVKEQREISGEDRKEFIQAQKAVARSIMVNVDVLTEGYDDPTVNAVVMARPTSSKLVYMQAMGRAVRIDPNNGAKEAYVLEVVDTLPNIRYRIENRWLYSDVSDLLEPDVIDAYYSSPAELRDKIGQVFEQFDVPVRYRSLPAFSTRDRITMLLFKFYVAEDKYEHVPLLISNDTRQAAAALFNFLAARMDKLHGMDVQQIFKMVRVHADKLAQFSEPATRKLVLHAMENAWEVVTKDKKALSTAISGGKPWLSFVSFRLRMADDALGVDLLQFTDDMLNKESVRETLRTASVAPSFVLVKFPLPLRGTWGVFLPPPEFAELRQTVSKLESHALEPDGVYQWQAAISTIGTALVPVEQRHIQSLTTIVRERLDYFRFLDGRQEGSP